MNDVLFFDQGRQAAEHQHWEQSVEYFSLSLREEGDHPTTNQLIALSYAKLGKFDRSILHLNKTLAAQENNLGALLLLVKILMISGKADLAYAKYRESFRDGVHKSLYPYIVSNEESTKMFGIDQEEAKRISSRYSSQVESISKDPTAIL